MTINDLVWLSIGEITLAASFAVGVAVGISLTRKESRHDSDDDTEEGPKRIRRHDHCDD
jgi:hypothetical protein